MSPGQRKRPGGESGTLADRCGGDKSTVAAAAEELSHLQRRVVQEAVNGARRQWWLRRAEDFERAKPRADDYVPPHVTVEQLRDRWRWCHRTADACRNKAALIPLAREEFDAEVVAILEGVDA